MARGFGATSGVNTSDLITVTSSFVQPALFSWAGWIYSNGAGASSRGRVYETGAGSNALNYNNSSVIMSFSYAFTTTLGTWTFVPPSLSAWHHIAITYNANSTLNTPIIYVDGAAVTVTPLSTPVGTFLTTSNAFYIGNRAGLDRCWDGVHADFAIWNSILSANDVVALSKGLPPQFVRRASLIMHMPLLGVATGEPEWGPTRYVTTVSGTAKRNHAPTSFWMPPATANQNAPFTASLALNQPAQSTAISASEIFPSSLALTQPAQSISITAVTANSASLALTQPAQSIAITATTFFSASIALQQAVQTIAISTLEAFVITALQLTQPINSISITAITDSLLRWRAAPPIKAFRRKIEPILTKIRTKAPDLSK